MAASFRLLRSAGSGIRGMRCCFGQCDLASYSDSHFHSRTEAVEDRHQPVYRESPQVRIADAREIGGGYPGKAVCRAHGQAVAIEHLDNFGREESLELLGIRVRVPEVPEH